MATYFSHDIETDDAGELQFENGDFKIASTKRTFLQALHWMILSSRPDCVEPDAMANLTVYKGRLNTPSTHRAMEAQIRQAAFFQQVADLGDLDVKVTPVSEEAVALTVRMRGQFIEDRPEDLEDSTSGFQVLGYLFPFESGVPQRVT